MGYGNDEVKTLASLKRFGYKYNGKGTCRDCGEPMDWFITHKGKKVCFNAMDGNDHAVAVVHWETCRAKRQQPAGAAEPRGTGALQDATWRGNRVESTTIQDEDIPF